MLNPSIETPGLRLKTELKARKITQRVFAGMIGMRPSHLSEVISGKRAVTEQLAIKLESLLDIPVSVWLELQAKLEYHKKIISIDNSEYAGADKLLVEYNELYDLKTISTPALRRKQFQNDWISVKILYSLFPQLLKNVQFKDTFIDPRRQGWMNG